MQCKKASIFAYLLLCSVFICSGCTPTQELQRSRKQIAERRVIYSQQAGRLYRQPPTHQPFDSGAPRLPEGMVVSYSPITGETVLVPKRTPARRMQARQRPEADKRELVASYSPLTGEAVWVPRSQR